MIQLRKNNITSLLNLQGGIQYSKNLIEVWISCPVRQRISEVFQILGLEF